MLVLLPTLAIESWNTEIELTKIPEDIMEGQLWPSRLPDLHILKYYLSGSLKTLVYNTAAHSTDLRRSME